MKKTGFMVQPQVRFIGPPKNKPQIIEVLGETFWFNPVQIDKTDMILIILEDIKNIQEK